MVCDPVLCKLVSDRLMDEFGVYIQPINYPTVPRGTARLRISISAAHPVEAVKGLARALHACA